MTDVRLLSDADRVLLDEAARLTTPADRGASEDDRLARYLALERALGCRGAALVEPTRDEAFVRRVVAALPVAAPPATVPVRTVVGETAMRLLALPAALTIIGSFHQTFEWQHWIAAAVLAVAPASLLLRGIAQGPVRVRDLIHAAVPLTALCLMIVALARAIDSTLARDAGWCCFALGLAALAAAWSARVAWPDLARRLGPAELLLCHQLGVVAFLGGSCLVLHS